MTRIITALDYPDAGEALAFVSRIEPAQTRLKVGNELFTAAGPGLIELLQARGFEVFLDLKFHDIPNTVAGAVRSAAALGVWMVNVHAAGGTRMLAAARDAVARFDGEGGTRLIGVTVLTSLADDELAATGIDDTAAGQVKRLASLVAQQGLDGVVCSAHEVGTIKTIGGKDFLAITPGIRPVPTDDDQRRVLTPAEAIAAGSDHLVIGRPITQADDPVAVLQSVNQQVQGALQSATDSTAGAASMSETPA